jgi:hypothetical protein
MYIDVMFPQLYDELLELLRKGTKVYILKDTARLKKLRIEDGLKKSGTMPNCLHGFQETTLNN